MLNAISIRDLVSIERLDLQAGAGLTVLTGETGAGKSILLDALGWVLGRAPDKRMVRIGREQASVTAEFSLSSLHPAFSLLEEAGLQVDRTQSLNLRRVVRAQGPSRAFVNNEAVSGGLLASLASVLVEVHAQHESLALLRPAVQRTLLDQYGAHQPLLEAVASAWAGLVAARDALAGLERKAAAVAQERETLHERLSWLEEARPEDGELQTLTSERQGLAALVRLGEGISDALGGLQEGENGLARGARELARTLRLAGAGGQDAGTLQADLARVADGIERALIEAQEAAAGLQSWLSVLAEAEPRLEAIEARLATLKALARRCQCAPEALAGEEAALRARLSQLEGMQDACAVARASLRSAQGVYEEAARSLSQARARAGEALEAAVMQELGPLRLGHARFLVRLDAAQPGAGGVESVCFAVATAPGAEPSPIEAVASGGELSRFALALRVALADAGAAGVMVFDEIDQGAGGAVAAAIGERLARLARTRQVLVVTHSPQVAACADQHWRLSKAFTQEGLGLTRLGVLDAHERQDELARMLAGLEITPEARAAAGRLLDRDPKARTTSEGRGGHARLAKAG